MTTASVRRIQFLLQDNSASAVARETGLSRYMVGRVASGARDVPAELRTQVRNFYQRDAYARARAAGFNATQARRFSWYAPETVATKIAEFRVTVLKYTEGVVGARLENLEEEGYDITQTLIDQVTAEAYQDVVEGLQDSDAPIEDVVEERY